MISAVRITQPGGPFAVLGPQVGTPSLEGLRSIQV